MKEPNTASQPDDSELSAWLYAPLILFAGTAVLPFILGGTSAQWTDLLLMMLVCWYLFYWIKVPWEIFHASRQRRVSARTQEALRNAKKDSNEELIREAAIVELRRMELGSLLLTLAAPVIGKASR
jgi:hypothetical protein